MFHWKAFTLGASMLMLALSTTVAPSQVTIGIGVAPECPYGYHAATAVVAVVAKSLKA